MGIVELLLTAIGLSMDAFAVSVCKGLGMRKMRYDQALVIGLYFGVFQALMPLLGWLLGTSFSRYIQAFDHWIAFVLLAFIGGKMLWDVFHEKEESAAEKSDARCGPCGVGGAVCGVLPGQLGLGGPWRLEADAAAEPVCQLLYCIFWLLPGLVLLHRLLWPAAVAVFVLGGVLPAQGGGPQTHGTAAPPGVPGAGLDGPALAFAVSAAPAGDLRRTFSRGSSFCIKGLTQPGSCGILSVVRRY